MIPSGWNPDCIWHCVLHTLPIALLLGYMIKYTQNSLAPVMYVHELPCMHNHNIQHTIFLVAIYLGNLRFWKKHGKAWVWGRDYINFYGSSFTTLLWTMLFTQSQWFMHKHYPVITACNSSCSMFPPPPHIHTSQQYEIRNLNVRRHHLKHADIFNSFLSPCTVVKKHQLLSFMQERHDARTLWISH